MALALNFGLPSSSQAAQAADLGNGAAATYDAHGNLVIGNEGTVAEGSKQAGKNNTTIGTDSDTLRNVTEGEKKKNGQPMDTDANKQLVEGEGKAHDLDTSTEAGGSTAVGYDNHNEGDRSTAIGNHAIITNKPVTYYVDKDGNKTASPDNAVWYKDTSGKPTKVPQVFRDADGNKTNTPQYIHTYTEKDPTTGEDVTKTEITSDATKADQKDGQPVYNYQPSDNTSYLYTVTLYQAASNSIAAGTDVTANGSNAVAVGYGSTADNSAVAIGDTAAAKENGVAIGKNTKATAEGSIALGKGSEANRDGGVAGWDPKTGTASTKRDVAWKSGEGALSIGNGGASRQITNVAAGSEDSDAVNLAQLKNAMTHYYSVKTTEATDVAGNNNYLNDGATGDNALAAGVGATASSDDATAVGTYANATASQATAIGRSASASSYQDTAIGYNAGAHGTYATAVGSSASATSFQSTAIGYNAGAHGSYAIAMGNGASATNTNAIAIGASANVPYENSTAVGASAKATDNQATAIGSSAEASGTYATALGNGASATSHESTAIGSGAGAHGSYAIAMGNGASATNSYAVAIGAGANAPSYQATALGNGANATDSQATAIGSGAGARGSYATALGNGASAYSSYTTALGSGAIAQSSDDTAIGSSAKASGGDATALGYNAQATAPNATALGSGASAYYHAIAIGAASASSSYALAAGDGANAQEYQAIALGYNAKSNVTGGVALGSGSTANVDSGKTGLDPHTGKASTATGAPWVSTLGALSVGTVDSDGTATGTRQINGIAAGTQDTDAVNVAQLKAMETKINMHYYSVNSTLSGDGSNYDNTGASGTNALAAGPMASASGEDAVAIGYGAQAEGKGATVIGQYGKATGRYALTFGGQQTDTTAEQADNVASGDNALSFGERTTASGTNSTAFGWQTTAKEKRATAFGERTTASGANSTAFGQSTIASGQNSTAFGNEAVANNYGSTAFGNRTEALGEYSTAFGNSTVAAGMNTVAFGTDTVAGAVLDDNGAYTNIIYKTNAKDRVVKDENGNPIELSREKMDARGNLAYLDNNGNTKSVTYTVPGGETHNYVLLQGEDGNTYIRDYRGNIRSAVIGDDGTVTVGDKPLTGVNLKQANAGANGYHILSNTNATVWGENSIASGEASTAFGVGSTAAAQNSLAALGGTVAESATNAAAIGSGAKATLADSVALGSHSVTTRAKYKDLTAETEKAAYAKGTSTGSAWEATDNAIAVGNDSTVTRQITGVAAGSLDTDAVNVAQLKAVDARHTTVSVGSQKATADNTVVKGGNLEMTRTTSNGQANYDVSLNKDIVLGQQEENKGGSIVVNSVGTFRKSDDQGNHTDYPMKEAVKIDGTTISVVKNDGSDDGGNDQRQVVIGVGQDTGGYVALYDNTGKKPTYIFNAISPGITYLKDKATYPDDANEFGRLEYGDIYHGSTQFIATLDDGLKFSGDQGTMSAVKLNQELSVTGGVKDADSLSTGSNIGVVSTPAVEDDQGNITQKAKLELKLNKDLTGLNTVTAGTAKIGSAPADTLKLTENGAVTEKTAPAGSYVTGLDNKDWSTTNPSYVSGRAATEDQLAAVSGTINEGLSFTTNTKDAANTTDNYKGYKVVNRKLGDTIAIKASDETANHSYSTKNLTTRIAENGDISILMDENPAFTSVTTSDVIFAGNPDLTDKDGKAAQADTNVHYGAKTLTDSQNITTSGNDPAATRLHYKDEQGHTYELATMDDGQIYAGDIKTDGTPDITGFGRKMNEKTTINGGVTDKDKLTDNNIGVVSNGTDTLTVKLAKDLKDLNSVTTGKTVMDDSGIKITNDAADETKNVVINGDKISYGGNQVTNMGSGSDGTADGKPTYNTDTNGANIGDVKNIAGSTTDAAKLTGDSNITVTYNDPTADGKNTVKLNDSITLGSDADKKVTIDGTAGTITAGDKVSLNGSTGIGSIGDVTIGNQTGVATTKMDGDKPKTENGTFVTGLTNTTWNPDTNGIVSGRAATEDQLKTVSDTVNAGWELDVNGKKQKAVTPTSPKVNFVQGQNISISGSGDDVTVATADDVRFTTIHVTGDKDDSDSYTGGITIGKQSGGNSANPGPGYYITGLENKSWNANQIQSGRAATEDQLKQVAEDIKHGTVDGDKYVTGGTATYGDGGKGSAKLTGTNGLEGTIDNLHDYYVTKGEVSDDGKTLKMTKNDGTTFDVDLGKIMQSDMRLVQNPAREDGKYIVDSDGNLKLTVQDANGTEATRQTITLSGLASKAEVDKGLIFAANSGTPYNAKLGNTVTVKGSAVKAGHDYSDENLTTEVDGNGNITIKMDKDLTADTMTVSGKDGKDGQIGITGKDGADGTVTTIIKTIGKNGTNGTDGTPGVNGTDGITRIVYQDGKDGDAGMTTHTVATLDDGLKFGANHPVVENGANPVGNKLNSTIDIKGAGTKSLDQYSGKNLVTSVEQDTAGNTTIHVLMDKNISADGVTVGQAGTDGVKGENGEVGQAGTIGINGKNGVKGENGKEGITTTIIRTEKGQPGKDGVNGKPGVDGTDITRIVYQNSQDGTDGKDTHTVATLDDGLKFAGDDGQNNASKVITKKLNERLDIVGKAKGDLTDANIGVTKDDAGQLYVQLAKHVDLDKDGTLKAGKATIGAFSNTDLTTNKNNHPIEGSYATGLSNKDWSVTDPEYVSGRAATEDQLAKVSKAINNATTAAGKRTVVTVNDKSNPAEATPSATADAYGDYDSTGGNLMIAAKKDSDGAMTYNIKLNDQLAIGQKGEPGVAGKDGKDGKVTVETKGGTTVIIGHDGKDGEDGKDGISVIGKDGQNGVSIIGSNGLNGKDGIDGKISIGTPGKDGQKGKDAVSISGQNGEGHIGLTGPKGADGTPGKDGISIDITTDLKAPTLDSTKNVSTTVKDASGKEATIDQAPRIQYKSGDNTYEVATMDDGLKFVGDDGTATPVTKKLNDTLQIRGDGTYDVTTHKTNDDGNIKISSDPDSGTIKVALSDKINLHQDGSLTVGGDTQEGSDPIVIKHFDDKTLDVITGVDKDGKPTTSKEGRAGDYVTGLDNKDWDVSSPTYVSGRAATEDQLKKVSDAVNSAAATAGKHTVVTVNDKDSNETKAEAGTGVFGNYAGADKGNLLIAAKNDNGQMTYNIKLNDQLAIGQKGEPGVAGKDGKDGKVTVETKGGTTVVIGHDGEPGKDGKDGLFVTSKDGADGVSITGPNGADGTDGKVGISGTDGKDAVSISGHNGEGHIGLTGPKGADGTPGKDGISIDITTDLKSATLDDGKNVKTVIKDKEGKETTIEQAPRIQYQSDGKNYEVATMDDGLKFVGNDGKEVTKKLNSTLSLTGGITDADALQKASGKNLGVRSNEKGDGLEIVMTDTPDFTKVTVGEGDDTTKKITIGKQTVTGKKSDGSTADQSQTGNYITGLDNKAWDKDNVVENRAATEGQLQDAIQQISGAAQGGFGLADENGATVKQDLGGTIAVKGDGKNIETKVKDGGLEISLKKDVDLGADGSVKAGSTTIDQNGVDTNKVKVGGITITKDGINGGSKQITNIASGIDGNQYTDAGDNNAASIGDVKQLAQQKAQASAARNGKNITVKDDHTVNLNDHITLGDTADKARQVDIDGTGTKVTAGDGANKVTVDGSNGQVVIGTGDSAMTLGKQANTAGDSNPKNGNYLNGLDNRKWDGEHIQNGRAATEDQLKTVSDKVKSGRVFQGDDGQKVTVGLGDTLKLQGGAREVSRDDNIGIVKGSDDTLQVRLAKDLTGLNSVTTGNTTITNGGLTIKTGDANRNITVQDGNVSMGGNIISGVAPGKVSPNSTDAVNGSQLAQRDQAIGKLGGAINNLDRRVDRVGAGAAALAALHPQDFDPDDKWDFAVGYGNYRGANAAAVGAFYRPNEDTTLSVGGTVGGGENMVNAGISFKFGQGNHVTNSRVAMAKEILALKDYVQKQDEKIEKLEALVGQQGTANAPKRRSILFPDVPENHWAYVYVKKLADRGLLEGYPDGEFKGTRTITRYEFAAIFSRALENGASVDGDMERMSEEFEPEIRELSLSRFRVDRVEGDDNDRHKIERVRVNDRDELVKQKSGEQKKRYRDVYGSVIEKDAPSDAVK